MSLSLFDVNKILHQQGNLIGEDENLLVGFLAFIFGRRGVIFRGFAGSGKSVTANSIWSFVPETFGEVLQGNSDKAIWYDTNLANAKYVYVREYQKTAQNVDAKEMIKSWGEDKTYKRKTTIVEGAERRVVETILEPRPILSTFADENKDAELDDEVSRRFILLYADPSSQQTKEVLELKAEKFSAPWARENVSEEKIDLLRRKIWEVSQQHELQKVALPGFRRAFVEKIPTTFHESRSVIDHFIEVISATTRFYGLSRIEHDGYLLGTPSDLFEAYTIYRTTLLNNSLRLQNLGEKVLLTFPQLNSEIPEDEEMRTVTQVMQELSHAGLTLPRNKVQGVIANLLLCGYLEEDGTIKPPKYYRGPMSNINNALTIDWQEVTRVMLEHSTEVLPPDKYKEYESVVYATQNLTHPVTGAAVCLNDLRATADPTNEKAARIETKTERLRKEHKILDEQFGIQWSR